MSKFNNMNSQGLVNMETHTQDTLKGQKDSDTWNETYFRTDSCQFIYKHFKLMLLLCDFTYGEESMSKHKPFHKCHISEILMEGPQKHLLKV